MSAYPASEEMHHLLDQPTLEIVIAIVNLISFLIMLVFWQIHRSENGPLIWAIASFHVVVGFFIMLLYPLYGNYMIFINNYCTLSSILLILEGVLRFRGIDLESRRKPFIIVLLLLFLLVSYINRDYPTNRYLTHDFISVILLSLGAYYMLYRTRKVESIVHLFTAAAFVFMAMGFAYRWYLAASGAIETVAVGSTHHPFQVVLFLMGIPWTLGWTYGFGLAMTFRSRQQLTAMANQDALTGLDNRRCLNNCIKHMLIGGKIKEQQFLLILIDINGFKIINDTFGHNFGDEVLITTAETIREAIRENDFAIRFGGDEFIVLMHFLESSEIEPLVKRLRDSLETVRNLPSMSLQLRVSIGTAIYPDDGDSIDKLLQVADIRMYNEKNENKLLSKVTFFSNQTANNC